jgi:hypothetical protein
MVTPASFRTPQCPCWNCGKLLDARMNVGELDDGTAKAVLSHVSICAYCAAVALIVADGKLEKPNEAQMLAIATDPMLGKLRRIILQNMTERRRAKERKR